MQAFASLGRHMTAGTHDSLLDRGALWLLHVVADQGPLRLTQLAQACNLDCSTVSRHARQLEDRGLVTRTPDPEDRRAQLIAISPAGDDHVRQARARKRSLLEERLAGWSRTDIETLTTLLERLAGQITTTDTPRKRA